MRLFAVLALPLLIAGCSPYKPEQISMGGYRGGYALPPRTLAQAVSVHAIDGDPRITVLGSEHAWPGHPYNALRLRSYKPRSGGAVSHDLYVDSFYEETRTGGGAVDWSRATADDGTTLTVTSIERKRIECGVPNACPRREIFAIALPDALLRSRTQSGLQIRTYGNGYEAVLAIGGAQILQQLVALDRL